MKRCPRCDKTYPDSETFCEADGTALVQSGPAFAEGRVAADAPDAANQIECPVCGGKAQPGELICNFCGARLEAESTEAYTPPPTPQRSAPTRNPAVRRDPSPSMRITGRMPDDQAEKEGRGMFGVIGYLIAAIIALGGGAWLALHLSTKGAEAPVANASPAAVASVAAAPAPAPTGPSVTLANAMGVQVTGESAVAPERNQETARKFFEAHKDALLNSYEHALGGDSTLHDAMVVRVRVLPNGNVDAASVRTSTNPNPAFDAEVVKDVSAWNFAPFGGGEVEIDYPVIFTNDPATRDALESQLSTRLAGLSPTEAPEFASAPPSPSPAVPEAASAPSPALVAPPPPPVEAVAPAPAPAEAVAPAPAPAAPRRHHRVASAPKPPPMTLQQRVLQVLSSNPRTRRVNCYTTGSTVTIFGKVFDADAKLYAEKLVRQVPGVGNVIDSLTTDTSDWAARQQAIASQLYGAGLTGVTVKVIGHDAYLSGTVKTEAQKQQAVTIAESASPVHVRGNIITVVPGNMFGF
jgi:TonB family protein